MLAAVRVGDQLLAPVLDPSHGMVPVHRDPAEHDFFGEQDPLVAESAADIGDDNAHLTLLQPETLGEPGAHDVRHLACSVDHEHFESSVPVGEYTAAFERRHALACGAKRTCDRHHGLSLDLAEIAVDRRLQEHVVAPYRMQQGRIGSTRLEHVGDGGQFLEFERYSACQILRRRPGFSQAGSDQLAGVADTVNGEHRLFGDLETG